MVLVCWEHLGHLHFRLWFSPFQSSPFHNDRAHHHRLVCRGLHRQKGSSWRAECDYPRHPLHETKHRNYNKWEKECFLIFAIFCVFSGVICWEHKGIVCCRCSSRSCRSGGVLDSFQWTLVLLYKPCWSKYVCKSTTNISYANSRKLPHVSKSVVKARVKLILDEKCLLTLKTVHVQTKSHPIKCIQMRPLHGGNFQFLHLSCTAEFMLERDCFSLYEARASIFITWRK